MAIITSVKISETKYRDILADNVTLVAGAGDDSTTSDVSDLKDYEFAILYYKLTNGATGPSPAAKVTVQTSTDNSNWYTRTVVPGSTANSAVVSGELVIDGGVYVRAQSGTNVGQNVTLRLELVKFIEP